MKIDKSKAVSFTGHRWSRIRTDRDTLLSELYRTVSELYKAGYTTYLCGMAQGLDLLAAEAVCRFRKEQAGDIRLIAAIPFRGQAERFSPEDKRLYNRIAAVSERVILSEEYYEGCFHRRNEFLMDNASVVVAYWDGTPKGGTYHAVQRAERKEIPIINLFK